MIYTVAEGRRDNFKCNDYSVSDGYIDFWNPELTKRYFVSIHRVDHVMIETIDNKEQEDEIKCIT